MEARLGCGQLDDEEFLRAFEECKLAHGTFHHADHIRLAWIYVNRLGAEAAQQRLLTGIQKMAVHAGAPKKFLHTTTVAWARLVAAASGDRPADESFSAWIQRHPELLNRDLLGKHYSRGRLETEAARSGWVEPDLAPL
ncbi:MAG TPA: hypothetical protein VL128_10650 [Candidatus Eisenbacteria bacterium]|nr:hypothetical protein [Candidatus Eisenbacteria bacterium]